MRAGRPVEPQIPRSHREGGAAQVRRNALRVAAGARSSRPLQRDARALRPFPIRFHPSDHQDTGVENRWIGTEVAVGHASSFLGRHRDFDLLPGTRARVASLGRHGAT